MRAHNGGRRWPCHLVIALQDRHDIFGCIFVFITWYTLWCTAPELCYEIKCRVGDGFVYLCILVCGSLQS